MDAQKIGQHIAALRKEAGMTQQELADQLNVTAKAVSKWETGHGLPDIQTIEPLARTLNVSIAEIMKGEPIPEDTLPLPPVETIEDTAAYLEEQNKLRLRQIGITAAGVLLGFISIPCAIIGSLAVGSPVILGSVFRVLSFLPLAIALILLVTGGILLIQHNKIINQIAKALALYLVYAAAVMVVFHCSSVYHIGHIPTPIVLARLILYPAALWSINMILLWYLKKKTIRQ